MISRRVFVGGVAAGILVVPLPALGQQAGKVYRIGVLSGATPEWLDPLLQEFREGLYDLGYTVRQLLLEIRYARGRTENLDEFAGELVRLKMDVIVAASSTPATLAAKRATKTIPIFFVGVGAPVMTGIVPNLARPGGNLTGSTILGAELATKRLQLVKELLPKAELIAILWNPDNPANAELHRELQVAAPSVGVKLQSVKVRSSTDFDSAFSTLTNHRPSALMLTADPVHQLHVGRVIDFAAKSRLPVIYNIKENVLAGGFMSYGANFPTLYRRAALYVDKILKGANPGDLPVEQPTKFDLVINLKTARALGLTIPQALLFRADDVIQ